MRAYDLPKGDVKVAAFDGHVANKGPWLVARLLLSERRRTGLPLAVPETAGPAERIQILRKRLDGKMLWGAYLTSKGMSQEQADAWFGQAGLSPGLSVTMSANPWISPS